MSETSEAQEKRRARIVQTLVDETGIDETLIRDLVHAFYAKIRTDTQLGPIFERAIGADWGPHLARMCDFWSSVMLMTGRYKGNPMFAHLRLDGVAREHFARWLALFRETSAEICAPPAAHAFVARAENIAKSLQLGMFYRPAAQAAAV
ncbi:MAG TPA: group III truncated hemoglobin [Rhizomicrobium sp.]